MKKTPILALALAALAIQAEASPSRYGMIGLTPGETLRINVANPELPPAPGEFPPGPCRLQLSFMDSAGHELLPAVKVSLEAGQSTHLDINGDRLFPSTSTLPAVQRMEIRPVVLSLPKIKPGTTSHALPPGPCVSSIEIIDNRSGKTLINSGPQNPGDLVGFNPQPDPPGDVVGFNPQPEPPGDIAGFNPQPEPPGDIAGFNPQPDPPGKIFGQLGLVTGQTMRLNAVNVLDPGTTYFPPGPCRVTLVLFGPDGAVLAHSVQTLNPGGATFLDFSSPSTVGGADASVNLARTEVRGLVLVESAHPAVFPSGPCRATLEVFDNSSGRTTAFQSPQSVQQR